MKPRKEKTYLALSVYLSKVPGKHRAANGNRQFTILCRTTSQQRVAELTGSTISHLRKYGGIHETDSLEHISICEKNDTIYYNMCNHTPVSKSDYGKWFEYRPDVEFDPYAAGKLAVEEMKKTDGGAYSTIELQNLFPWYTNYCLQCARQNYRIIYWKDDENYFYPKWQFDVSGKCFEEIQIILGKFKSDDTWRVMLFFLSSRLSLNGKRVIDIIKNKELELEYLPRYIGGLVEENNW